MKPSEKVVRFAEQTYALCQEFLEQSGSVAAVCFIETGTDGGEGEDAFAKGELHLIAIDTTDDEAKDASAEGIREHVRRVQAEMVTLCFEAWGYTWPRDKPLSGELYERIKHELPRHEILDISIHTPDGGWHAVADIHRDEAGNPSVPEQMPDLEFQDPHLQRRSRFYPF